MSSNDPFFQRSEELPPDDDLAPLVLPVDRQAEAPLVLPVDAEEIPTVLPAPKPPHPGFWWAVLWCVGLLMVTQTPGSLIAVAGIQIELTQHRQRYTDPREGPIQRARKLMESEPVRLSLMVGFAITEVLVIVASIIAIRLVVGCDWKRRIALRRPSAIHFLLVLVGMAGLLILSEGLDEIIKKFIPSLQQFGMPDLEELAKMFEAWPWPLAVLIVAVGPAVGEELWFRGFLGRGLVGRHGATVGVLLTSFLFGFIHLIPRQAVSAAILGIALHYVYLATRSLYLPMFMHFVNNAIAVSIPSVIGLITEPDQNDKVALVYLGAGILVASVGWALYLTRARLVSTHAPTQPAWHPPYPGVEYPPPASGTVVHRPWPGWLPSGLVAAGLSAFLAMIYLTQSSGSP